MKTSNGDNRDPLEPAESVHTLLNRLDLATEVLEGLDELGVHNRNQLLDLMARLERQIDDEDQPAGPR